MPTDLVTPIDIDALKAGNQVPLSVIHIGEIALRGAQLESEGFKGLHASIEANGILQPLLVRQYDKDRSKLLLVDGLQRYTIAKMLKMDTVPVHFGTMDELEMMAAQIQTNLHKIQTKPAAYGQQLRRMMSLNPLLTVTAMAKRLGTTTQWISLRISLHRLVPEIAKLVDEGQICVTNAFSLAKLPEEEQLAWVERAVSVEPKEFCEKCDTRARELKELQRAGKDAAPEKFVPVRRLRPPAIIKQEFEEHTARQRLVSDDMSASDAFDLAVAWTLHQDAETLVQEEEAWKAEQIAKKSREEERKQKRDAEKAEKAQKVADAASVAATAAASAAAAAVAQG